MNNNSFLAKISRKTVFIFTIFVLVWLAFNQPIYAQIAMPVPKATFVSLGAWGNPAATPSVTAGDINNDGYSDLVMGDCFHPSTGIAYIFYGKAEGISGSHSMAEADSILTGEGDSFGLFPLMADLNKDGYSDVIVHSSKKVYIF